MRRVIVLTAVLIMFFLLTILMICAARSRRRMKTIHQMYYSGDDYDGGEERSFAIHKLIRLAFMMRGEPIIHVPISTEDRGSNDHGVYSFTYPTDRPDLRRFCGPDWCCYWWKSANIPNYLRIAHKLEEIGRKPPLTSRAGWVGNIHSALPDVPEHTTRPHLYSLSKKHPVLLEVVGVAPVQGQISNANKNYSRLEEQVKKYKYMIDIGGNGYSGRLKMILWSRRPVLLVERRYVEYFHDHLIPYKHFVPVREDLSDLVEKIEWCNNHQDIVEEIAENALLFAQSHFTLEKILISVYENVMRCAQETKHLI